MAGICPNCNKKINTLEEYWVGDDVEISEVYKLDKNKKAQCIETYINGATIDPSSFAYNCPKCGMQIYLEVPSDVGGDSERTDKEIISDFLSGKTKGKPSK